MSLVEQFPYNDRNPSTPGFDLMPDLPLLLRSPPHVLTSVALVDSGATIGVLPYSLGVQLGFDWNSQNLQIRLTGSLAQVQARGIAVEALVGLACPRPPRSSLGRFGSSSVCPRTIQLLSRLRRCLFPFARVLRESSGVFFRNALNRNPVRFLSIICGYTFIVSEEANMNVSDYCIISETTEDRFHETDSLEEAIRLARAVVSESQAGDPVSIEHRGRVIWQLVLLSDGSVSEEEIR